MIPENDKYDPYAWREISILIPRIGTILTRDGAKVGVIWPGTYFVRQSRTMGKQIYRVR